MNTPKHPYFGGALLLALLLPVLTNSLGAQAGVFQTGKFKSMDFRLFSPETITEGQRVPLIVGLHGIGKREAPLSNILLDFHTIAASADFQQRYPCYVLAPHTRKSWFPARIDVPQYSPEDLARLPEFWRKQHREALRQVQNPPPGGFGDLELLLELIDDVVSRHAVDPSRIYVLGFSMGGSGTWQAIAARPRFFAAAVPAAGGRLMPWQWTPQVMSVPIWAFQGTSDRTTVADRHESLFAYARKVGGTMKYTEFVGAGHDIVPNVFTPSGEIRFDGPMQTSTSSGACDPQTNLWKWLFAQKRPPAPPSGNP